MIAAWEKDPFFQELETMVQKVETNTDQQAKVQAIRIGVTAAVTGTVSVAYVAWLAQSGALTASMMSSLPAWFVFDPLPTFDNIETKRKRGARENTGPVRERRHRQPKG